MPSPKRWLQPSSDGGQNGGAGNGAAESLGERAVLEEVMPGAEEHLEEALVAEGPNVGMNPNVDMVGNAEAEGRAVSVSPRPGEKRNWDETGGMDVELEATVLRVMLKHGFTTASSSSSCRRMVSQETQTELSGEVALLEKVKNKISDGPGSMDGGDLRSSSGSAGKKVQEPQEVREMHPEEILELEAVIQEEREQENAQLEQLRLEADSFLKGSEAPMVDSE